MINQEKKRPKREKFPRLKMARKSLSQLNGRFLSPPPPPAFVPMHMWLELRWAGACQQPSAHMPPSLLQESILPYVALLLVILFYVASNPIGAAVHPAQSSHPLKCCSCVVARSPLPPSPSLSFPLPSVQGPNIIEPTYTPLARVVHKSFMIGLNLL